MGPVMEKRLYDIVTQFRSSARLAMGNYAGALEDAKEALTLAPRFPEVSDGC